MLKYISLFIIMFLASCTISNAQNIIEPYDAGNGIYYISADTMREILPAVANFKKQHPECNITAMAGFGGTYTRSILINCK